MDIVLSMIMMIKYGGALLEIETIIAVEYVTMKRIERWTVRMRKECYIWSVDNLNVITLIHVNEWRTEAVQLKEMHLI